MAHIQSISIHRVTLVEVYKRKLESGTPIIGCRVQTADGVQFDIDLFGANDEIKVVEVPDR